MFQATRPFVWWSAVERRRAKSIRDVRTDVEAVMPMPRCSVASGDRRGELKADH